MNREATTTEIIGGDKLALTRNLYDRYGAMLFGYICEIVKDQCIAEQYLIEVFNQVKDHGGHFSGNDTLSQLQKIARKKLEPFFTAVQGCDDPTERRPPFFTGNNKFTALMTPDQRHVFCEQYYHGKTVAMLAAELNKPEETIRKLIKGSFTIIRKSNGH